ncbi:MAG: hypothetical protein Q9195_006855 [Heterodermia aff. obscurata]
MLRAPLLPPTVKLDISLLLESNPSPPQPTTHPQVSRSVSVPTPTSQLPIVSSPATSTASQFSTSTAPPHAYNASAQQQQQQQQYRQHQVHGQRRANPVVPTPAPASATTISKRPPPANPHPSASPAKKHNSKWGPEEDALIISLRGRGMKWEDISKRFPGRSIIACRLHYQNYLERRTPWDDEKKDKLARLYDRMKPEMWAKVAEDLQVPWRAAEAMHWALGEAEMARRAGVVAFSMAPAGYGEPSSTTTVSSSLSSASGVDPSGYNDAQEDEVGFGRRAPRGEENESYGRLEGGATCDDSGDQGVLLPSLAEFEGGVPAYAGFVGEMRTEGRRNRGGRRERRGGSREVKEEEGGSGE